MVVNFSKEIDVSKIRMERARLKISQKDLAEKAGTAREKINAIENGRCKKVKYGLLEKIANAFDIQAEDLLKKEER